MRITKETSVDDIALSLFVYGLEKSEAVAVLAFVRDPENEGRWYPVAGRRGVSLCDAVSGLKAKRAHDEKLLTEAPQRAAKALLDQAWGLGALARVEAARRDRLAISEGHRQANAESFERSRRAEGMTRVEWAAQYDREHDN